MRRIVEVIVVLGIVGLFAWMLSFRSQHQKLDNEARFVTEEVRRFELEIKLRAATADGTDTELTGRKWPSTIDPNWFEEPPRNTLLSPDRPWVEVAPPEHSELTNPVMRIALSTDLASFWYNPYQGVIRARVPVTINDRQALALYNQVNRTSLTSLYAAPPSPTPSAAPKANDDETLTAGAETNQAG